MSPLRSRPRTVLSIVSACALLLLPSSPVLAQEETPPPPPQTIDLRVDGDPLLVLFERIARDLDCGLVAHESVIRALSRDAEIEVTDAQWEDAVALFATEYGIAVRRTADRIVLVDIDAEFRSLLVRRSYPVEHLSKEARRHALPDLGHGVRWGRRSGGGGLLSLGGDDSNLLLDSLPDMIPQIAGRGTWDRGGVELTIEWDRLIVRQIPAVHAAIESFLADLERRIARQVVCRFTALPPGDYGTSLSAAELEPLVEGRVPKATWIASDGQLNHWFAGEERHFVEDVEFVSHIADPVVTMLRTGWGIEVTPHVTRAGVVANVSIARAMSPRSSLRALEWADGSPWIEIEAPELEFDQVQGVVRVPSGGASVHRIGGGIYALEFEVLDPREP